MGQGGQVRRPQGGVGRSIAGRHSGTFRCANSRSGQHHEASPSPISASDGGHRRSPGFLTCRMGANLSVATGALGRGLPPGAANDSAPDGPMAVGAARPVGSPSRTDLAPPVNIATEALVRAPADGYTRLLVGAPHAINATLYDKLTRGDRTPARTGPSEPSGPMHRGAVHRPCRRGRRRARSAQDVSSVSHVARGLRHPLDMADRAEPIRPMRVETLSGLWTRDHVGR